MPEDDPKYGNVKYLAGSFAEALYDDMLGVGKSLEARGDLPEDAEEFATVVSQCVLGQLGGALMKQNRASEELEAAQARAMSEELKAE
jgi:hypothetical protein